MAKQPVIELPDHSGRWQRFLDGCRMAASSAQPLWSVGRLTRINGLVMEASGLKLPLGSSCRIFPQSGAPVEAEVVGFSGEKLFLMPSDDVYGLAPGAKVVAFESPNTSPRVDFPLQHKRRAIDRAKQAPVGYELLGRVLDSSGRPLDSKGPVQATHSRPLQSRPINPMTRASIEQPLDVEIRPINALLTVGRGQRMGLFAGSGVGKSVLLGMMARYTEAEVIVVGLIGERGREVKEFIEQILGEEGMRRAVVVAAPADTGPLMRLQGAQGVRDGARHRRVFSRSGPARFADHGFTNPLRHGSARDCPRDRRATGNPWLSPIRICPLAATGRTGR